MNVAADLEIVVVYLLLYVILKSGYLGGYFVFLEFLWIWGEGGDCSVFFAGESVKRLVYEYTRIYV